MHAENRFYFHKAADVLGLSDKIRTILLTPNRSVKVGIAIAMGWIMHEYSRYAGYSTGQAGKVTP